jgi:hypothetical protein
MTRACLALAVALLATLALLAPAAAAGADPTGLVLVPVGQRPLSDRAAAKAVVRSRWEPRPRNAHATHRVPSTAALRAFHRQSDLPYARRVTGRFRGTTDEVIQWAAAKWGLAPDLMRGVAAIETWWVMGHVGDGGDSFGLFQVRRPYHCRGRVVCGLFRRDAAFNADYYAAALRSAFDGRQTWLNTVDDNGAPYAAGDLWGAVGLWFAGRWHVPAADAYAARVQDALAQRVWSLPSFAL